MTLPSYDTTIISVIPDDEDAIEAFHWNHGQYKLDENVITEEMITALRDGKVLAIGYNNEYSIVLRLEKSSQENVETDA